MAITLARLTSLSTQTLSLLLERQRLQQLSQSPPTIQTASAARNLAALRSGIIELELEIAERLGTTTADAKISNSKAENEALRLLRSQFARMRAMLGANGPQVDDLPPPPPSRYTESPPLASSSELDGKPLPVTPLPFGSSQTPAPFVPYSDEPQPSEPESSANPTMLLEQQRLLVDRQDAHLEHLSLSIGRQHDISLQINEELGVHHGLLEEFDHDVGDTQSRLSHARKKLARFGRGVKGNLSAYILAGLIFVLLILIIVLKT